MIGRVNVRIFDQPGQLLVKVDSSDPIDKDIYAIDDGTGDRVFKRAHATLCAVVSDIGGRPHIHIISDTNAKKSIMETDNLNIFQPIWYHGSNFEFVDDPINHKSSAKLILFDATVKGHSMQEVITSIMERTTHVITHIDHDSKNTPIRFVDPTTAQQSQSIENYHQRKEIANGLHNEYKFSYFESDGQHGMALRREYLELVHNWDLHQLTSHMSEDMHKLLDGKASRSQYRIRCEQE